VADYRLHHGTLPLGWVAVLLQPAWAPTIILLGLAILLFPDGRPPSPRWRWVLVVYLVVGLVWLAGAAYALVTGLLVGVYAGAVLLATHVLTLSSPVAVAGSTLAAVALFNPLRRRVQHRVDRRFNRARYDADQTVAAFAARLKDTVDLDSVRDDLAGVVHRALEPAHVSVWTNERG